MSKDEQFLILQSFVKDILFYAEHDEILSEENDKQYSFNNVVVSISEEELNELNKIVNDEK